MKRIRPMNPMPGQHIHTIAGYDGSTHDGLPRSSAVRRAAYDDVNPVFLGGNKLKYAVSGLPYTERPKRKRT